MDSILETHARASWLCAQTCSCHTPRPQGSTPEGRGLPQSDCPPARAQAVLTCPSASRSTAEPAMKHLYPRGSFFFWILTTAQKRLDRFTRAYC